MAATTGTTTKFGFRHWGSQGDLRTEYWISGAGDDSVASEQIINFTAGSIETFHSNTTSDRAQRSQSATFASTADLILALNGGNQHIRKSPGWKALVSPQRIRRQRPALDFDHKASASSSSTCSPNISPISMSVEAQDLPSHRRTPSGINGSPPEKKMGFFKRTVSSVKLGHGKRPSNAQNDYFQNDAPQPNFISSPSPQDRSLRPPPRSRNSEKPLPAQPRSTTPIPKSALRRPSVTTPGAQSYAGSINGAASIISAKGQDDDSGVVMYPDGLNSLNERASKGIRFAEGTGDQLPTRPRRTSSAATHGRRSSIYSKAAEGDYMHGVDAGVGSKARRLSVMFPDELHVEECRLEDHFSMVQRHSKKDIGEGGAAVVKLMKSKTAGDPEDRIFAVKEFRPRDTDEEDEAEYQRKIKSEFAISKSCQHPNIVKTFRLCRTQDRWYHVMEYCELGDLNDLIKKNYFTRGDRDCMFKQLVRGLDYLHSRGIAHRDIKSENLLVNRNGCLKIADFGTGEVFCGEHPGVRNCEPLCPIKENDEIRLCAPGWVGSRPYMAPEIVQRTGGYDPRAVDVWSAAIVYLTLWFGGNPWDSASADCKNFNIYCGTWDRWLERFPDGDVKAGRPLPEFANSKQFMAIDPPTKEMIFGMLHPDPEHRWQIRDVLDSKIVKEAECCQQESSKKGDDLKLRQRKVMHNHIPPTEKKKFLSAK